jgi:hypothetical protein
MGRLPEGNPRHWDAIDRIRRDPRVTADRIAVWVFSGAGLMLADRLRTPPTWLRCGAATYPLLARFENSNLDPAIRVDRGGRQALDIVVGHLTSDLIGGSPRAN